MQSAHEAAGATGTRRSPRPLRGGRFINGSGALRGEGVNVCLMDTSTQRAQSSSPAKEPVKDTDLILRSLRSKRLEGWTQRRDSRPSFETRARGALLRMRSEICFTTARAGDPVFRDINDGVERPQRTGYPDGACHRARRRRDPVV